MAGAGNQAKLHSFGPSSPPPLPRVYSTSHILTYRNCPHKFLLNYIFKLKVETKFEPTLTGRNIHADISEGIFTSPDIIRQTMLTTAWDYLDQMPQHPVFETDFKDPNNPGVFKGRVFDLPFLGIFDVHWPEARQAADWKSGKLHKDKAPYEIQAYILNELFRQQYKHNLRKFEFVFLKSGEIYEAQSIQNGPVRKRTETKIKTALDNIKRLEFPKKVSWACDWCDFKNYCI